VRVACLPARSSVGLPRHSSPAPTTIHPATHLAPSPPHPPHYIQQSAPDGVPTIGMALHPPKILSLYVWIYCLIFFLIQDAAKVGTFKLLRKYNTFGINTIVKSKIMEAEEAV
jgi:hypothetical protein